MNLDDIRSNEEAVKWWAKVFNNVNFREGIWKMLNDTHPLKFTSTQPVTTASSDKRLGEIEGYELALERLRLCAQHAARTGEMPPATFEPYDPSKEEKT